MSFLARAGMRATLAAMRPFGAPIPGDLGPMDPGMAAMIRLARRAPPRTEIKALRDGFEAGSQSIGLAPDRTVAVRNMVAGGRPARRYDPPSRTHGRGTPTLVFFHGGGFLMGSLNTHDTLCRAISARAGIRVVAVEYRLAPEHPFPAAVDDAAAAYRQLRREFGHLVAVGGDSAGANLAAVVCQVCRDAPPALQWLLYPVVDMDGTYPSTERFADGFLLTREALEMCARQYIPAGQNSREPWLSPLFGSLDGMPPAILVAAGFDPLRDQVAAYAAALRGAGVTVRDWVEVGLAHGFASFAGVVPEARRATWRAIDALREELA